MGKEATARVRRQQALKDCDRLEVLAPKLSSAAKGSIDLTASGVSSGGSGQELDLTSGLQIHNGNTTVNVDVAPASVVVRPEVGLTVMPAVSSSTLLSATSEGSKPL